MCFAPAGACIEPTLADLLNAAVVADEDRGMIDVTAGRDVEHPIGGNDGHRLRRSRPEHGRGRENPSLHPIPTRSNVPNVRGDAQHCRKREMALREHCMCTAVCDCTTGRL